ncbi:MAG TPA: ribosome silencing factor [Candidatus Limnocylindria bacterium]|jgi:ribosome-associated protein|nr:ribosome silencing factor [Candidatus Limnocylindria bacterium]
MARREQPTDQPADIQPEAADPQSEPAGRPGLPRRRRKPAPTAEQEALALARRAVDLAADKKASDIVLLEVGGLTTLADYFVICSGTSERQIGAIADGVVEGLRGEGSRPIGREGSPTAHWLLIDYGSVIVHVMAAPERDFYQLERLWSEAPLLLRVQ